MGSIANIADLAEKYGDKETKTFRLAMADRPYIFVSDKDMLKEIMVTKSNYFEKPKEGYEPLNIWGESILTALNNETWKKHFKVCCIYVVCLFIKCLS